MQLTLCCPTLFGLEGHRRGRTALRRQAGPMFTRKTAACCSPVTRTRSHGPNLNLRCAERVLIRIGTFHSAKRFDAAVRGRTSAPVGAVHSGGRRLPGQGVTVWIRLCTRIPDCQKIVKKAVVSRLGAHAYGQTWFDETGAKYQIQFAIMHDVAELYLDTSRRRSAQARLPRQQQRGAAPGDAGGGYGQAGALARTRPVACDPFCGSGTIAIEAAMIAPARVRPGCCAVI